MSVYRVTGATAYRGHNPGETFEANLEAVAEARAIRRNNIQVVHQSKPALVPGSYTLPRQKEGA